MAQTDYYGRSPLPAEARRRMGLEMLLWMAVIFSPFVAFAVNGKVDDSDWTPAYVTAGVSLLALALLSARRRANYRNLPAHLRDEHERGKSFAPLPNERVRLPRDFKLAGGRVMLHLTSDGVAYAPAAWLGIDERRTVQAVRMLWRAAREARLNVPTQVIAWRDIREWEVHEEMENDDFYRLTLVDGGYVRLRRPADAKEEYELLDAVRSVGRVPVRMFCDIPRPPPR